MKISSRQHYSQFIFLMIILVVLVMPVPSFAQWSSNNNAICKAPSDQSSALIVTDGNGGAIIAWGDSRNGTTKTYAQRIDSNGALQWTVDGIIVSSDLEVEEIRPSIVPDGNGGAIIAWIDLRNGTHFDIYAQRINSSGAKQWGASGVAVSTSVFWAENFKMISDGSGGAIVAWEVFNPDGARVRNIHAQRILANGSRAWAKEELCVAADIQENIAIIPDGSGGAILTWTDFRNSNSGTTATDIYAQRINANGNTLWQSDGIGVCVFDRFQDHPALTSDGSGGAIITWKDDRAASDTDPSNTDIYAQRINSTGTAQWAANGIGVSTTAFDREISPSIASDEHGGAIIAWQSLVGTAGSTTSNLYVQRINSSGIKLWTVNGINFGGGKEFPILLSDGNGGAFLGWEDYRGQSNINPIRDIFAQHLDPDGSELWAIGGVAICDAALNQSKQQLISDDNGGAIFTWVDNRGNGSTDIYAQRIQANGTLGGGGSGLSNQVIYFDALPDRKFSEGAFTAQATASSQLPVSLSSSNTAVATIEGNVVTLVGVGATTITASQSGSANFNPAESIARSLTVTKGDQEIKFDALPDKVPGDPDFTLSATSTSALAISYASSNTSVATVSGNTISIKGAGTTNITASQSGNANYNAATNVVQTLSVKSGQVITFSTIPDKTLGDPDFTVSASSNSGLLVTFSVVTNKVSVNGNVVKLLAAGSATIHADQSGNTDFATAPRVSKTFCINPSKPSVTVTGEGTGTPILTSGSAAGNQWFRNGIAIDNATNNTLTVDDAGVYTVVVTVDNCHSVPSDEKSFLITGIEDPGTAIKAYPNPMANKLIVDVTALSAEPVLLTMYDAPGNIVIRTTVTGRDEINVSSFQEGFYLLKIKNGSQVIIKKLVK